MSTTHPIRRALRRTAVGVALAGAVVAGVVAVNRAGEDDEPVAAPEPLTVATAQRTDLSADATLDGIVESSSSITVLHRIEGATPSTASASTGSQASTATAPSGAAGQGMGFAQPVSLVAAAPAEPAIAATAEDPAATSTVVETTPDTEASSTTSSAPDTTVPPETSSPATAAPAVSVPAECPTTTTSTISTTAPVEPAVPDPSSTTTSTTAVPVACTPTTDATVPTDTAPTDTAPAVGGMPSGGQGGAFPGGGTGGSSSGSGTGTTGVESGTTSITERVTSLPAVGDTVALGDILYTVDGRPVVALTGTLPAWRSLSTSSDDGPDIAQLELSLSALGYDADGSLVVDNEFDSATADAVEAWQVGLGLEATGEVELGDVVFLPSTVTVTARDAAVGADVTEADQILHVSGSAQQVVATVTDDAVGAVVPGSSVQIAADAGPIAGIVTLLRSVAAEDGTITAEAVITPTTDMADQAGGSSVDVTVAIDGPTDAITVPAQAIVSRLDGTYAVEVRDETGDHWVTVEILDVRGSNVAVAGIGDGTQVLVPA